VFERKQQRRAQLRLVLLETRDSILESPMGVENYVASLKLTPVTDGNRTFAEWSAEFDPPAGRERRLAKDICQGVFQAGFTALKGYFGRR
jgi:hypothetical protein